MNATITAANRLTPQEVLDDVAVTVLLDGSSSMDVIESATRAAANDYIAELQSGTAVTFSLACFADTVRWAIAGSPIDSVKPLTHADYSAYGNTALYDALGEAIERVEAMNVPPVHPVIAIFTDGDDTFSHRYTAALLKPMIEERRERGWRFIAFVAGDSAAKATGEVGILPADTAPYAGDAKSTKAVFKRLAASTKRLVEAVETKALPPATFL
jgi:uncharacterized protein YegL